MENIVTNIANLGFPIVVSMYLLARIEPKLDKLAESIFELSKNIGNIN